jgi:hypothetical protein
VLLFSGEGQAASLPCFRVVASRTISSHRAAVHGRRSLTGYPAMAMAEPQSSARSTACTDSSATNEHRGSAYASVLRAGRRDRKEKLGLSARRCVLCPRMLSGASAAAAAKARHAPLIVVSRQGRVAARRRQG